MNRRSFFKTGGAGLVGATFLRHAQASESQNGGSSSQRRIIPLNHNWLYSPTNLPNGTSLRFDDRRFQNVTIPHTNKVLPWHGFDDKEYEFVSLYRRHFTLPQGLSGRRIFVDFGGVMTAATYRLTEISWVSTAAGTHPFLLS